MNGTMTPTGATIFAEQLKLLLVDAFRNLPAPEVHRIVREAKTEAEGH